MKKALIFSCAMGSGHKAAAKALEEHLDLNIVQIDLFALLFPIFHKHIRQSYSSFHQKKNYAFRVYQKFNQHKEEVFSLLKTLAPLYLPVVEECIVKHQPDLLLSTYSISSLCLSAYKRNVHRHLPLITAITDLSPHLFWISEETDLYLVAAKSTKHELLRHGISEKKIVLSGIPTSPRFKPGKKEDLVLVSGGGLGLLPEDLDFYQSLLANFPHVKVLCGSNTSLYKKLRESRLPLEIASYLPDLSEDYKRAKLLITKPGGITTFEALHTRTPLLLLPALLEQEKSNEVFIHNNLFGRTIDSNLSDLEQIDDLLLSFYQKKMDQFCTSLDSQTYEKIQCLS